MADRGNLIINDSFYYIFPQWLAEEDLLFSNPGSMNWLAVGNYIGEKVSILLLKTLQTVLLTYILSCLALHLVQMYSLELGLVYVKMR